MELPRYGVVTALAVDPIEKKPLYHFRPGSRILSAGFAGCNLRCPFCQNWHISQNAAAEGRVYSPAALLDAAGFERQIAYTYSEPLVHVEFLLDCMAEARKRGVANVLVSNGCVNAEAADAVLALTDAANIDLKCFSEKNYREILGGSLEAALAFLRRAHERGVHLEITTLVVPGLNDSEAEMDECAAFIASLSPEIPWHLSAYHPAWKYRAPATDPARLAALVARARRTLRRVYLGNVQPHANGFSRS